MKFNLITSPERNSLGVVKQSLICIHTFRTRDHHLIVLLNLDHVSKKHIYFEAKSEN